MKRIRCTGKSILAAFTGVFLVGTGVAFNNCAGLGNDPVGIVYDGIRQAGGMTGEQLGMASNLVNLALLVMLFFVARRYISIGTLVYFLPYGFCVDAGGFLYHALVHSDGMAVRIAGSVAGCLLLYLGVAVYIAVDIGVDPFTGVVLWLRDVTKRQYRIIKVLFDISMIVLGTVLGGRLGAVTIITALTAGPMIQLFSEQIKKFWMRKEKEN